MSTRTFMRSLLFVLASFRSMDCQVIDPSEKQSDVTFTHTDRILTPEEMARDKEEMMDLTAAMFAISSEVGVLRNERSFVLTRLKGDDLALFQSVVVDTVRSQEINAFAHFDDDGKKYITFTSGLYQYLDDLVVAQVMSREFHTPDCDVAYAAYLTNVISTNVARDKRHLAAIEVYLPKFFADHHTDICPHVTLENTNYSTKGEYWAGEYQSVMAASILFAYLHEFAHIRNGDGKNPDVPTPCGPYLCAKRLADQRRREEVADDYALDFFTENIKEAPYMAIPIMFLAAVRQNYAVGPAESDHPLTVDRITGMMKASRRMLKSASFERWAGERDASQAAQDSKKFQDYLNALVKP